MTRALKIKFGDDGKWFQINFRKLMCEEWGRPTIVGRKFIKLAEQPSTGQIAKYLFGTRNG